MAFREGGCVRRHLCSRVNRPRTTANMRHEARGRLDHARRAHSHEHSAFVQSAEDAIQLERYFAKPADVWTNPAAALALGKLCRGIVGVCVAERQSAARVAAALEKLAVHVDDALRACLLVQIVYILGAEEEAISQTLLQLREREMRRVGLRSRSYSPTHGIELPDQPGVAVPRMGRSDLLDPVVPPETIDATERGYPALGAYACPCEDEEAIMWRHGEHRSKCSSNSTSRTASARLPLSDTPNDRPSGVYSHGFFAN
jgi:hypothetical protein